MQRAHCVFIEKNLCISGPKQFTLVLQGLPVLTDLLQAICNYRYTCYVLYSYNKVSLRKENIIKGRKSTFTDFKKNPHISGLGHFKPKLFKGQL